MKHFVKGVAVMLLSPCFVAGYLAGVAWVWVYGGFYAAAKGSE